MNTNYSMNKLQLQQFEYLKTDHKYVAIVVDEPVLLVDMSTFMPVSSSDAIEHNSRMFTAQRIYGFDNFKNYINNEKPVVVAFIVQPEAMNIEGNSLFNGDGFVSFISIKP